ncbi:MAG: hypothetical protein J5714_04680 [Alphaproteobacteria bacterium]|nr:hypothetical protein [Alphaproteobacteria bacterium]
MKTRIFILSSLLCAVGAGGAFASDSEWDDATISYDPIADTAGTEVYRDEQTSVYIDYPDSGYTDISVSQQSETVDTAEQYGQDYQSVEISHTPGNRIIANNQGGQQSVQINHAPVTATVGSRGTTNGRTAKTGRAAADYSSSNLVPMRNVKLFSIKPVQADNLPPVWDGTDGNYKPESYVKTVDWRNGVPIWDDSISDYRTKDFRDWMLMRLPELYIRDSNDTELVDLYAQTMAEAAATNARIEELLGNKQEITTPDIKTCDRDPDITMTTTFKTPCDERYTAQDLTIPVQTAFGAGVIGIDDGCPFDTETECNIWRRKPIIRETVSPRSPKIRGINMTEILFTFNQTGNLDANSVAAAPLLDRYKMLMRSASACCTEGMKYSLKQAGASNELIYKFLADDANFYNIGGRCLMMSDAEIDEKYSGTATAMTIADVRNGCLCRGRQWFNAMLAPFVDLWNASPEFESSPFYWTYIDGLQREVTVAINDDVKNVLDQLATCP